jgi:D-sedoheptulose 7-phosphate isomerase
VTDFLYPFIDGDERDGSSLLHELAASAAAKTAVSVALRDETLAALDGVLATTARAMTERFRAGGRLVCFGNGGSATDAAGTVALFAAPPSGRPLAARSLVGDVAVITALANDVGFDAVFARQLMATAAPADIVLGLSTSGGSRNVLRAFAEGHRIGALTVGLAGYDGGEMAQAATIDHCLVVHSDSVHRIQETQTALIFELWSRVQQEVTA